MAKFYETLIPSDATGEIMLASLEVTGIDGIRYDLLLPVSIL